MELKSRGWRLIRAVDEDGVTVPKYSVWRKGWEPFCVELELWDNEDIRGRLAAPGLKVHGNLIFSNMPSVDEAATFLEKLLVGATAALPTKDANRKEEQ